MRSWVPAALAVVGCSAPAGPVVSADSSPTSPSSGGLATVGTEEPFSSEGGAQRSDDAAGTSDASGGSSGSKTNSSSGGDSSSEDSGGASVEPPPGFVDVTEAAGLALSPGSPPTSPDCVLDNASQPEQSGDFCFPELFTGAAAVADVDGDGWLDVYLTRRDGPDRLLHNLGDGTFVDIAEASGLTLDVVTGAAAWLDVDRDDDLDLMLTAIGTTRNFLMINDGSGHFSEEALARGAAVASDDVHVGTGIGVGDYDLDGWLDVFVADWRPDKELGSAADHNRLLRGVGAAAPGSFVDVTDTLPLDLAALAPVVDAKAGVYGFAPAFVDLDDDGWPELTLTADFGTSRLLWNEGGTFIERTWDSGVGTERNGMGSSFGDVDGDGDLDWFVSAIWADEFPDLGHRLYRNEGDRTFVDISDAHGIRDAGWGWGAALFDHDLDGDLDLAMAAGWPTLGYGIDPLRLWENTGEGLWPDRAPEYGIDIVGDGRGLVPFDYDRDGDLDLLVVGNLAPPHLFRNDVAAGDWLVVRARGTQSNRGGIGARVELRLVEHAAPRIARIGADTGLMGQAPAEAHFGFPPDDAAVFEVAVTFPASGKTRVVRDVPRNQVLVVEE